MCTMPLIMCKQLFMSQFSFIGTLAQFIGVKRLRQAANDFTDVRAFE